MTVEPLGFELACPRCRAALVGGQPHQLCCPVEGTIYTHEDGIWRCLLPERQGYYRQFIQEYESIRRAEGRGMAGPAYYRALPFADLSGKRPGDWRIRAHSFNVLCQQVLSGLEDRSKRPLKILDIGAGNGWLSNRLTLRGHTVAAVDLLVNPFDGLGTHWHYQTTFLPVQAEFERLPFTAGQADLVIFNASLHYAVSIRAALAEALRLLKPAAPVIVMDTPIYRDGDSGVQMARERTDQFERQYGFRSDSLPSENYLTNAHLAELAGELGLHWRKISPFYGLAWALRPWKARLRGRREPASFTILVGQAAR